jgi:hypothetical protein
MKLFRHFLLLCVAGATSGCITEYPNPATQYVQRIDTVTLAAGDAQDVNAATHTIDPWPPYSANRRIPGNGARLAGAVERYEGGSKGQGSGPASGASGAPAPAATGAPPLFPLAPVSSPGSP